MAKRQSSSDERSTPPGTAEDAFTARVFEFIAWARTRTQTLIVGIVLVVLLVAGGIYWYTQRDAQLNAAAAELETLQQNVPFEDPATAVASVEGYLDRYGGTSYAIEARLLLARVHLVANEDPASAIAVLQEVAPGFRSPLNTQATFMLAAAYEQAEDWDEAAALYEQIGDEVELPFQIREAGEGLARSHLAQGDTAAATEAYRSLLEVLDADDPTRARYEMRVAEFTAGGG